MAIRALIAEADAGLRMALGAALHAENHEAFLLDEQEKAVRAVCTKPFDLVIAGPGLDDQAGLLSLARQTDAAMLRVALVSSLDESAGKHLLEAGADDVIGLPCAPEHLDVRVARAAELASLRRDVARLRRDLSGQHGLDGLVGRGPLMRDIAEKVRQAAAAEGPVLVVGEAGTGKDHVARAIHDVGVRRDKPLVTINCTGVAPERLGIDLFGRPRDGLGPSRERRVGAVQAADGGTLLLDNVEHLPESLRDTLLTLISFGMYKRVGEARGYRADVRVLATAIDVPAGAGRSPLFSLLTQTVIRVPTLRERLEDLPDLVEHFVRRHGGDGVGAASSDALAVMGRYPWPGNVRELENAVRRALTFGRGKRIAEEYLTPATDPKPAAQPAAPVPTGVPRPLRAVMAEAERNHIAHVLRLTGGNRSRAAELLGICRKSLWEKTKAHEL